jgi:multiple sugar transport system ATP-binding protein
VQGGIAVGDQLLEIKTKHDHRIGREVWIGIRPEHLVITSSASNVVAVVEVVEPLGHGTMLHINTFGTRWVALDSGRSLMLPGDQIHLEIKSELVHLFDRNSGVRID